MKCKGCDAELTHEFVFSHCHIEREKKTKMYLLLWKCPHHSWENPFRHSHTKYVENKYYTEKEKINYAGQI